MTKFWPRVVVAATLVLGIATLARADQPRPPSPRDAHGPARAQADALFDALAIKRAEQRVMAPEVPLTDTEGKRRKLSDFSGKLVLVNFWATWCRPCLVEMPELDRLYVAFKDRGFVVVAISTDVQGPEYVRRYVAEKGFRFPAFSDPDGIRAGIPFRLVGVPTSYLIGHDGTLLGSAAGPRSWAGTEAMALIGALLDAAGHRGAPAPEGERQMHSSEGGK